LEGAAVKLMSGREVEEGTRGNFLLVVDSVVELAGIHDAW
jgi:hypothetical protein